MSMDLDLETTDLNLLLHLISQDMDLDWITQDMDLTMDLDLATTDLKMALHLFTQDMVLDRITQDMDLTMDLELATMDLKMALHLFTQDMVLDRRQSNELSGQIWVCSCCREVKRSIGSTHLGKASKKKTGKKRSG